MISGDSTSIVKVADARADTAFQQECLELIAPYYSNPEIPLRYAFEHESTHVYFSRGNEGCLTAVFFARTPEHVLEDLPLMGYLGLTATAATHKDRRLARPLWRKYLAHSRERASDGQLLAWYRTATPFGLYPCHNLLNDGEPRSDGCYSDEGATIVRKLRNHYGLPSIPPEHPFVVRRYAAARYSEFEQDRIARFCRQQDGLLGRLAISEPRGDRLLMLGHIP